MKAKGDIVSEVGSSNVGDGVIQDFVHEFTPAEILSELEKFILEMGSDFAFLGRQKRITVDDEDYYIDLLFYHRKF